MIVPGIVVNRLLIKSQASKRDVENLYTIFELNRDSFVCTLHEKPTRERESQSGDSDRSLEKEFELSACHLKAFW